jgi:hypothetical protein
LGAAAPIAFNLRTVSPRWRTRRRGDRNTAAPESAELETAAELDAFDDRHRLARKLSKSAGDNESIKIQDVAAVGGVQKPRRGPLTLPASWGLRVANLEGLASLCLRLNRAIGLGEPRARIHTSCAVGVAPTFDRAFAR